MEPTTIIQNISVFVDVLPLRYITLQWSYLEWPKYKTAKPLLYMVHTVSQKSSHL